MVQSDTTSQEVKLEVVPPFTEGLLSATIPFYFEIQDHEPIVVPITVQLYVASGLLNS